MMNFGPVPIDIEIAPSRNGHSNDEWIALIEAWQADPTTWNIEEDGPPPNDPSHRISLDVVGRFKDRQAREAAAAKQAAGDVELRNQLIAACNGNFTPGPGIEDIAPIKAAIELVPLDLILSVIRWKVCKLCCPANPTLTSWRDPRILRAIAKEFCDSIIIPKSVYAWSAAGTAPGKPVQRAEPSPAVQVPPKPQNAQAVPPENGSGHSGDNAEITATSTDAVRLSRSASRRALR